MEKYIALIVLSAPGFVAYNVACGLGVTSPKKGEFSSIAAYLSYSFFSVLLCGIILSAAGLIDFNAPLPVEETFSTGRIILFLFVALLTGIFIGVIWGVFGDKFFNQALNILNVKLNRNKKSLGGSLLNKIFNDGKDHFIIVRKDDKIISVGFIFAASDPFDDRVELVITEYPEYREELKLAETEGKNSPLKNTLQTYIDISSGFVITETEYPAGWLSVDSVV